MIQGKKIIYKNEKTGLEYYFNTDGKLVQQRVDLYKDYRKNELAPEVQQIFSQLRSCGTYPTKKVIDRAAELDPGDAVSWLRWRYFGEPRKDPEEKQKKSIVNFDVKKQEKCLNELKNEVSELRGDLKKVLEMLENQCLYEKKSISLYTEKRG